MEKRIGKLIGEAKILNAVSRKLKDLGYDIATCADNDVEIAELPSGALVITHPAKQPIAILINPIGQETVDGYLNDDGVS